MAKREMIKAKQEKAQMYADLLDTHLSSTNTRRLVFSGVYRNFEPTIQSSEINLRNSKPMQRQRYARLSFILLPRAHFAFIPVSVRRLNDNGQT